MSRLKLPVVMACALLVCGFDNLPPAPDMTSTVPDPVFTMVPRFYRAWPENGWRVSTCVNMRTPQLSCSFYGPPLEFVEQCHVLAKMAQKANPVHDAVSCSWSVVDPHERDLRGGVL